MHKSFKEKNLLFLAASVLKHFGAEMRPPLTPGSAETQFLAVEFSYFKIMSP